MEIRQLRTFCKAVESESFTRTAESLWMTQSAVSQQIRQLEKELGVRLFDRKVRAIAVTPAGRTLYDYACRLLALYDETLRKLGQETILIAGEVRVVASTIPGEYILPSLLTRFRQEYPQVKVSILIADSRRTLDEMERKRADIGIVGIQIASPRLEFVPWLEDDLILIVPCDHSWAKRQAIGLEELQAEPFILREEGSGTRACVETSLNQTGLTLHDFNINMELGSAAAVREAVLSGAGVSIVSRRSVAQDLQKGVLAETCVAGLRIKRSIYMVHHRNRPLAPTARKLFDYLLGYAASGDA